MNDIIINGCKLSGHEVDTIKYVLKAELGELRAANLCKFNRSRDKFAGTIQDIINCMSEEEKA
jgi:hypothetical protein